jgi:hypothetical protein
MSRSPLGNRTPFKDLTNKDTARSGQKSRQQKKSASLKLGGLNDLKQTADEAKNFELQ